MSKIKNLTIYSKKIYSQKSLLVLSDIHRTNKKGFDSGLHNLESIYKDLLLGIQSGKYPNIDTILLPGDIINDTNDLQNQEFKEHLIQELLSMTRMIPTYISLGNHDQMTMSQTGEWKKGNTGLLKETISKVPNARLLENGQLIELDDLSILAISPEYEYYEKQKESEEAFSKILAAETRSKFNSSTYNILLTHTPIAIMSISKIQNQCPVVSTYLVVTGHMHNGVIKLPKTLGLISPQRKLFPQFAHGTSKIDNTTFVINGPVNTRVESPKLNQLFQPNASIITLKPEKLKLEEQSIPKQFIKK